MNESQSNKQDGAVFKSIFRDHWDEFIANHPQYDTQQYAEPVRKMLCCGEEFGGYIEYFCMNCGLDSRKVPFSCGSCFCLSCAKKYCDDFVGTISSMLHPGVVYRHIVLTLPEQLRIPFYQKRHDGGLLSAFMRAGYECLEDALSVIKRKSLKIGCMVVVQANGRSGGYNPHLHIIMTNGGIAAEQVSWFDCGYLRYEIFHKKWQYHLFGMLKNFFKSERIDTLVDRLWKEYPKGLVANVGKSEVPASGRGLARYLAKYLVSPPISVRRIIDYDGQTVSYWYQDHKSKSRKFERLDVLTFIGRMVQHILPKWFQRVRYYGLQATKTFKKWAEAIRGGIKKLGRLIKGTYKVIEKKNYRERYREIGGNDPLICRNCGHEMELLKIWHPKYGVVYDGMKEMEIVECERELKRDIDRKKSSEYDVNGIHRGAQMSIEQWLCNV